MTKLDKLRDEMASEYAQPRHMSQTVKTGFDTYCKGFNAARDVLLPEVSRLVEALKDNPICDMQFETYQEDGVTYKSSSLMHMADCERCALVGIVANDSGSEK